MSISHSALLMSIFFLCDIQTKFKNAVHGYHQVVSTANKMIYLAKLLDIPVVCTTQNTKALGPTDPAIDLTSIGELLLGVFDKTLFSMVTPDVTAILNSNEQLASVVLFGIESHICVLQTALTLLAMGKYQVYIVADGVSSCNSFEIPIALERMRTHGAIITTSESIAFELMADANRPQFKPFSKFIKDHKESTKVVGEALLQGKVPDVPNQDVEVISGGVVMKSSM